MKSNVDQPGGEAGLSRRDLLKTAAAIAISGSGEPAFGLLQGQSGLAYSAGSANVTSGAAPLTVLFSALGVPDATTFGTLKTTRFNWDFGDASSGNWAQGAIAGASRNVRHAPWAGHVYEHPGTYVATLTVTEPSGAILTQTFSVTVQDPDVVYAGAKTLCISDTGDFTGAPANCTRATASDLASAASGISAFMNTNPGGNFRILLRGGGRYTSDTTGTILQFTSVSGVRVGTFGTGGRATIVNNSTAVGRSAIIAAGVTYAGGGVCNDIAVSNLDLRGNPANTLGFGVRQFDSYVRTYDPATLAPIEKKGRFTVYKCSFANLATPIALSGNGSAAVDNTIANCVGGAGCVAMTFGFNGGSMNCFIAGNSIDRSGTGEHTLRAQGMFQFDVYSNRFKGASAGKHLLAIREFTTAWADPYLPTQYGAVSNNVFDATGGLAIASHFQLAPENTASYGLSQYVICDHNFFGHYDFAGGSGYFSAPDVLSSGSQYIIHRHNIHEQSAPTVGSGNSMVGVQLLNGAATTPETIACTDWFIDRNSVYCGTALKNSFVSWATKVTKVQIWNTLMFAPACVKDCSGNGSQATVVAPAIDGSTIIANYNSSNYEIKWTDPQWVTAAVYSPAGPPYAPIAMTDFQLKTGTGSYALTASSSNGPLGASLDLSAI